MDRPHNYHGTLRRIPPARILACEMEARDISVIELAALSGLSDDMVQGVLDGLAVDAAISQGLSRGLGSSCEFWLRLQSGWEDRISPTT